MYGPPSSGQKTSQFPQSLQASAQFASWCGDDFAPPAVNVRSSAGRRGARPGRRGRGRRSSAAASRTTKFASFGQTGTHLSQLMQSKRWRCDPILRGSRPVFAAAVARVAERLARPRGGGSRGTRRRRRRPAPPARARMKSGIASRRPIRASPPREPPPAGAGARSRRAAGGPCSSSPARSRTRRRRPRSPRRPRPRRRSGTPRRAPRGASTRASSARTWSGSPERYASSPGMKSPGLTTTSVFVTFKPKPSPSRAASPDSSRAIESASSQCRSSSNACAAERDVRVPEPAVQDLLDLLVAEERRVQLHDRVEALLREEVPADRVDLVGRTAVERRERDRVREARVARDVGEVAERGRQLAAQRRALLGRGSRSRRGRRRRTRPSCATGCRRGRSRRRRRRRRRAPPRGCRTARRGSRRGAAPSRTRASDSSTRSSCDHSTLKPTVRMSMHGRGITRWSFTCTVLSSRIRPPARNESAMFCASCVCGPAAGPMGVAAAMAVEPHRQVEAREAPEHVAHRQVVDRSRRKLLRRAAHEDGERERAERAHAIRSQSRAASSRARAWIRARIHAHGPPAPRRRPRRSRRRRARGASRARRGRVPRGSRPRAAWAGRSRGRSSPRALPEGRVGEALARSREERRRRSRPPVRTPPGRAGARRAPP